MVRVDVEPIDTAGFCTRVAPGTSVDVAVRLAAAGLVRVGAAVLRVDEAVRDAAVG